MKTLAELGWFEPITGRVRRAIGRAVFVLLQPFRRSPF